MPIANYTTSIRAEKTVGEVQGMLAAAGAFCCEETDMVKRVRMPELGKISRADLQALVGSTIETYRMGSDPDEAIGIVLKTPAGTKKILRIEAEVRRSFLVDVIVGGHFAIEDYW